MRLLLLAVAVVLLALCLRPGPSLAAYPADCALADTNKDGQVDIVDITGFLAPIRYQNTNVGDNPPLDVNFDTVPGKSGLTYDINIQDMTFVILAKNSGQCKNTPLSFWSYMNDADDQWNGDPTGTAAMMNANYEAILTFDCGICRAEGNAFNNTTYVYQDPTKICAAGGAPFCTPDCEGEQPGTDCSDRLAKQGGGFCYQKYFVGERWMADITQQDVQDDIVAHAQALEADSAFDAIYYDVAEPYLPTAVDCEGGTPVVSNAAWLSAWCTIVTRVQSEVNGPLVLNAQWGTWQDIRNISESDAACVLGIPTAVEQEFGWLGENASNTITKLAYADYVHSVGGHLWQQEYDGDNGDFTTAQETYGLAMYFLAYKEGDQFGTYSHDGHGTAFSSLWSKDEGYILGPRTSCGTNCYQRQFGKGVVTANISSKTGAVP